MRIALIADTFPPMRTSGAVQMRDLAKEFVRQGHDVTVMLPAVNQVEPWILDYLDGIEIIRLRAPRTKDVSYTRRTAAEFVMPFAMWRNLRKSPLIGRRWDGVVWYAPSIFHGPFVKRLKTNSGCKSYLIIRDIFPEWALDIGLMSRGLPYAFFKLIAFYQYSVADVIGVQSKGNKTFFERWKRQKRSRRLEELRNWLDKTAPVKCSIRVNETRLVGRKIFVYAGNMGVAQGTGIVLDLAEQLQSREDLGFLFVGRGSDAAKLKQTAEQRQLNNVAFFEEIDPNEIPGLYAQCHVGIVALDSRHKSHNIPGKFLTYMQNGLPVLANINHGNDLAEMIVDAGVGEVCESNELIALKQKALNLIDRIDSDSTLPIRCRELFEQKFSVQSAVKQIIAAL